MSDNPAEVRARLMNIAVRIERNIPRLIRNVVLSMHSAVVFRSPVDKGDFVSNWVVTIGAPAQDFKPAYYPGTEGSTADANRRAATDQAVMTMAAYDGNWPVYITNNAPYAGDLNSGSSDQAPAGFVEHAIQAGAMAVGNVRLLR